MRDSETAQEPGIASDIDAYQGDKPVTQFTFARLLLARIRGACSARSWLRHYQPDLDGAGFPSRNWRNRVVGWFIARSKRSGTLLGPGI